jgi:hypothetical protein
MKLKSIFIHVYKMIEYHDLEIVRRMKQDGIMRIRFANIDIRNNNNKSCKYISSEFSRISGLGEGVDIPSLLLHHYRKYNLRHFKTFCNTWVKQLSRVIIAYMRFKERFVILGVAFIIEGKWIEDGIIYGNDTDVYIRCLCSSCFCGGDIIRYIKKLYKGTKFTRLKLNSEPEKRVLDFYYKHGFVMLENCFIDQWGIKFPEMIYCFDTKINIYKGECISTSPEDFFPGIMFYVFMIPRLLSWK